MNIPNPSDVLTDLDPVLPIACTAIMRGAEKVQEYFEHEETQPDRNLGPDILRWHAKRYFDHAGHTVYDLNEDYEREYLGNNGLQLIFLHYRIRILKCMEGELPTTGISQAKREYYNYNQLCFEFPATGNADHQQPVHLVLLWDVNSDYKLTMIRLALPKRGSSSRGSTEAYWYADIPFDGAQGEFDGIEDLDIKLEEEGEEGGGPGPVS